jgi:cation diffusion facilitator family transporter
LKTGGKTSPLKPGERERSLAIALAFCLVDVLLMGTAALHSNSLTILSDFLKELGDTTAVLAAFITVRAVRRAPSHRFTYGIGKLENLVSMSIVVLMTGAALVIAVQAFHHLWNPVEPHGTVPGIVIFSVYAVIGFAISLRNRRLLKLQHSPIIASQARLWFAKASFDALMALSLIVEIVFRDQEWSRHLDPLASFIGVAFMLHSAWSIATESVGDLLDVALGETMQMRILRCLAERFDDYDLLHKIRTRRSGPRVYVELFLEFDPKQTMEEVRERIERIRFSVADAMPGADITVTPSNETPLPS